MKKERCKDVTFEFIGGKDVMPIMGFYGPTPVLYEGDEVEFPSYFTDECFEAIAGSGINIIGSTETDYEKYPELVHKMLELGTKHGLGIFVRDDKLVEKVNSTKDAEDAAALVKARIDEYSDYPSYCGNHVIDEPNYLDQDGDKPIGKFARTFGALRKLGIFGYGNLNGIGPKTWDEYQKYVNEWVRICNPPMVSYDLYKFGAKDIGLSDRNDLYFDNLTIARDEAEKAGVPFWAFVQAGSQFNDAMNRFDSTDYFPSKGELFWGVGSLLAFGAKGIQYFPLIQPYFFAYAKSKPFDFERNGILGAIGNKTRWYPYAQEMNAQIAAVDEVLMNATNVGVIAAGDEAKSHMCQSKYYLEGTKWRELAGVDGYAMIGCFDYQGKTALYVVNYDVFNEQTITLKFTDVCDITVIKEAKESSAKGATLELELTAGNSALVLLS